MGNFNSSALILQNTDVPSFRFNPFMVDFENIVKNDKNLLWLEYLESQKRLNKIQMMIFDEEIKNDKEIDFIPSGKSD